MAEIVLPFVEMKELYPSLTADATITTFGQGDEIACI